jgi:phenylalanine-4-hydroxylase
MIQTSMPIPPETRPDQCATDWTIDQGWASYTPEDHGRWTRLYERQMQLLPDRACAPFLKGLETLDLHGDGIPDFTRLNQALEQLTGWTVHAVPGLIPDAVFFEHLANRRFPAGNFIRSEAEFDYIEAPDVFHDVFGHVPLLTDPVFADYMQAYGKGGMRALGLQSLDELARLYWYSVEFGLIRTPEGLRIYGAGILSSPAETVYALESATPHRIDFRLERVMQTLYRIDDFQETYFVINGFEDLFEATAQDFGPIYARLEGRKPFPAGTILPDENA